MTLNLLLAGAMLLGGIDVQVKTLDGKTQSGSLSALTSDQVTIDQAGQGVNVPAGQIMLLTPQPAVARPAGMAKPSVWVELVDGSQLQATSYTVAKGIATVTLLGGGTAEVNTRSIENVRLKAQEARQQAQWETILSAKTSGDVIVIRKTRDGADGAEIALDYLEGLLYGVTAEMVQFEFDGDLIDVNRDKVEGLRYFHPVERELPDPLCLVVDAAGSHWNVKAIDLAGENLQLTSVAGIKHELPLARLQKLDYSAGKILFISDLEPDLEEWRPYLDSSATQERAAKLFGMRRDQNLDGLPLRVAGEQYEKGIALHSRTEVIYRLPGSFKKFVALAGIDDSVRGLGRVKLEIYGDSKQLLSETVTGDVDPLAIDVDLKGVRRLKIIVDYGDDRDVGDHLNLCNARVLK